VSGTSLDLSQIRTDALSSAATFRTLIGVNISSFATAAEGDLAASALQPADIASGTITPKTGNLDFNSLGGGGDVVGPDSAVDNAVARYDTTTGKLIQQASGVTISDNNEVLIVSGSATARQLRVRESASQSVPSFEVQNNSSQVLIALESTTSNAQSRIRLRGSNADTLLFSTFGADSYIDCNTGTMFFRTGGTSRTNLTLHSSFSRGMTIGQPVQLASSTDANAANSTLYFSTTQNKLVYKDAAGVVNNLY
jgi:hypothetical protein